MGCHNVIGFVFQQNPGVSIGASNKKLTVLDDFSQ